MKLNLSVKDRFVIPLLYPLKSNLQNQVIMRDITKKTEVSQTERVRINCRSTGAEGFTWDDEKCEIKEVDFTESEICFLKSMIKKMDRKEEIMQQMVNFCLKIKEIDLNAKENQE